MVNSKYTIKPIRGQRRKSVLSCAHKFNRCGIFRHNWNRKPGFANQKPNRKKIYQLNQSQNNIQTWYLEQCYWLIQLTTSAFPIPIQPCLICIENNISEHIVKVSVHHFRKIGGCLDGHQFSCLERAELTKNLNKNRNIFIPSYFQQRILYHINQINK